MQFLPPAAPGMADAAPAANDNALPRLPATQPAFPSDDGGPHPPPRRSAATSAPGMRQEWLVLEQRSPPFSIR
jgi:hypothetical protein